jgi:hypothetical protein
VNEQRVARHIVHCFWSETLFGHVNCLGLVAIGMLIAMSEFGPTARIGA